MGITCHASDTPPSAVAQALLWPSLVQGYDTSFAAERLSPSARERVPHEGRPRPSVHSTREEVQLPRIVRLPSLWVRNGNPGRTGCDREPALGIPPEVTRCAASSPPCAWCRSRRLPPPPRRRTALSSWP